MVALWAEMDVIVADQFRDGNVGAQQDPLSVAREAYQALPEHIAERWFRGDSGCYEQELLRWLRNGKRSQGPEGYIGFAISARMSESLKERAGMVAEGLWKPYREDAETIVECAELYNYDPLEKVAGEELDEVRYLLIRVLQPARGVVRGPNREVLCGGDQHLGEMDGATASAMALGESRIGGSDSRRNEE